MARTAPQPATDPSRRTSVAMPDKMRLALRHATVEEGYGLRGKSRWVSEALDEFLLLPEEKWVEMVAESDVPLDNTVNEYMSVDAAVWRRLQDSVLRLRHHEPTVQGPLGAIVRTAITWRIMRPVMRGFDGQTPS